MELTLVEPHASFGTHPGVSGSKLVPTIQSVQESWNKRSESIKRIFQWLRHRKNVKRILKLVVIDDGALPCSDSTFEDCLQGFDIRYLSWNKEDLCIDTLRSASLSNVKELWLSWSGRNSVLHSWSCKETGLAKLSQVKSKVFPFRATSRSPTRSLVFPVPPLFTPIHIVPLFSPLPLLPVCKKADVSCVVGVCTHRG